VGKKERRSLKDKARALKERSEKGTSKSKPKSKSKKSPSQVRHEKEMRRKQVEEGRYGLPGAGRATRIPSKKQKERSRKDKHKKPLYAALNNVVSSNTKFSRLLLAEIQKQAIRVQSEISFSPLSAKNDGKLSAWSISRYEIGEGVDPSNLPRQLARAEQQLKKHREKVARALKKAAQDFDFDLKLLRREKPHQSKPRTLVQTSLWAIDPKGSELPKSFFDRMWKVSDHVTEPLRSLRASSSVPIPDFDDFQAQYFRGPAKTALTAMRRGQVPSWGHLTNAIKTFEKFSVLLPSLGHSKKNVRSIEQALTKLKAYSSLVYPNGKPKSKSKSKKSPGKILSDQMSQAHIVSLVNKLRSSFKGKPAEAAQFAYEVLEDANFHADNRLFRAPMVPYDPNIAMSPQDVAQKLRWSSDVLPFAAALLVASGAKGVASTMLKRWGENHKDWFSENS
jgi:hypothetical protein